MTETPAPSNEETSASSTPVAVASATPVYLGMFEAVAEAPATVRVVEGTMVVPLTPGPLELILNLAEKFLVSGFSDWI